MIRMTRMTARQALAPLALGVAAALLVTGCQQGTGATPGPGASSAAAAASSAHARARAEASSSAGQAARQQADVIAGACQPKGGWNALAPGVPGASDARRTFEQCEKIPKARLFSLGVCLVKVYQAAPAKGAPGSAAETARQTAIANGTGGCVETAKGIKPPKATATATATATAKATATATAKATASASPSGTGS